MRWLIVDGRRERRHLLMDNWAGDLKLSTGVLRFSSIAR